MKPNSILKKLYPRVFARYLALPLFGSLLEEFSQWLSRQGYPNITIRNDLGRLRDIEQWLRRRGKRTMADLTDQDMVAVHDHFMADGSAGGVARSLKKFLRESDKIPLGQAPRLSIAEREILAFSAYLEKVHGFAAATVGIRQRQISCFLKFLKFDQQPSAVRRVRLEQLEDFIRWSGKRNSRSSLKQVVAAVRTYLRWKHEQGCLREPLHEQVNSPLCYRMERLPKAWPWEQVAALLRSIDRTSPSGHRDFTMLFLAAKYGLRSSELVGLKLEDINWRSGTIRISQRKTRQALLLPLSDEAGDVLKSYLRKARAASPCRELFLRLRAPMGPLDPRSLSDFSFADILKIL